MTSPLNTFATQSSSLALSQLDDNFTYVNGKIVSVKDYGAVGDGTTDDTVAINLALASGALRIFAPAATYRVGQLIIPSNVEFFGDGNNATIFRAKNANNAFVVTNSDSSGGNVNITLRDFRIEGNSANQTTLNGSNSGVVMRKVTNLLIENVYVNDAIDWGFAMYPGNYVTLRGCVATAIVGIDNISSVRAGFLFGVVAGGLSCNNLVVENCTCRDVTTRYVDGFIAEYGTGMQFTDCLAKNVPYSGFKTSSASNVTYTGCYANNCLVGFQQLGPINNISYVGNTAYSNAGTGFLINQSGGVGTTAYGVMLVGNKSIDNGTDYYSALYGAAGGLYGIWVDMSASSTINRIVIADNLILDNGAATQLGGIILSTLGTIKNLTLQNNIVRVVTTPYNFQSCVEDSTLISDVWKSFTPVLKFGGGTTGITYGSQVGRFRRQGQTCQFQIEITLTSKGSSTGAGTITGLPYVSEATSFNYASGDVAAGTVTYTGTLEWLIFPNTQLIDIRVMSSGNNLTAILDTAFANTSLITISGSYETSYN